MRLWGLEKESRQACLHKKGKGTPTRQKDKENREAKKMRGISREDWATSIGDI